MTRSLFILPPTDGDVAYRKMQIRQFSHSFILEDVDNFTNILKLFKLLFIGQKSIILIDWFHMYYSHPSSLSKTSLKFVLFIFWVNLIKIIKIPIIINLHNIRPHDSKWKKIDYWSYRCLLKNATLVRCFSEYNKRVIQRYFKLINKQLMCVYEDVQYDTSHSLSKNSCKKNELKTFLVIGQIRRYKRILEIIVQLRQKIQNNEILLRIIGNSYDKDYVREISECISKYGLSVEFEQTFLTDEQFDNEIIQSDYVIVNSNRNYNSGVLSKCISFNKPCIIRSQFGNIERMNENKALIIVNNDLNAVVSYCLKQSPMNASSLYVSDLPNEQVFVEKIVHIYDNYVRN